MSGFQKDPRDEGPRPNRPAFPLRGTPDRPDRPAFPRRDERNDQAPQGFRRPQEERPAFPRRDEAPRPERGGYEREQAPRQITPFQPRKPSPYTPIEERPAYAPRDGAGSGYGVRQDQPHARDERREGPRRDEAPPRPRVDPSSWKDDPNAYKPSDDLVFKPRDPNFKHRSERYKFDEEEAPAPRPRVYGTAPVRSTAAPPEEDSIFRYMKHRSFSALVPEEFKGIAAKELVEFGARDVDLTAFREISFTARNNEILYRILYGNRLLARLIAPLHRFDAHHPDQLYDNARRMEWGSLMTPANTFAIVANVGNSKITHSQFAALRLKDAICDYFRDACGERPSVDTENPDVLINLHISQNKARVNLDLGGGSLHRRGYRKLAGEAPMQETLAAAIVRFSGWGGERPLLDPMCGAGTLAIEAMMDYCRIPGGYLRPRWGHMLLPDFDSALWQKVKDDAAAAIRPLPPGLIFASDCDARAISNARANAALLPGGDQIEFRQIPFQDLPEQPESTILINPPYGIRLDPLTKAPLAPGQDPMEAFCKELGDFLKFKCPGSKAFVYFGEPQLLFHTGLKPTRKMPLSNGGLEGRLCSYELYSGSKFARENPGDEEDREAQDIQPEDEDREG
ncbi:MAG: hypothetical protein RL095_2093 [Verrucomicrobiota bacterium]|jgi:putative N6-adenine-specific DNA methylase